MNRILIKNAKIVNEGTIFQGDVLIENEFIVENMLNEAMRYPHLLFAMTININFSSVGYDPKVRRITKKRFLQGKAAFSEGAPEVSLVVRRS